MKKMICMLLALAMMVALAACGAETETPEETVPEEIVPEEVVPEEVFYSLGDTVKTESIE